MEKKVSVVIPVYNSAQWLEELVTRIQSALNKCNVQYEIILVNDGSPQIDVWFKIAEICEKIKQFYQG